jgi:sugar/nucleoside kinase (ribokinase family)
MAFILSYARRAVERHDFIAAGDVMVDVAVAGDVLPHGGHVTGKVRVTAGGSAANAAAWARSTGASAGVLGRVGDDVAGMALRAALEERGIEAALGVDKESPTGAVLRLGGTIVAERGANARFAPDDLPQRLETGALLVSGYLLLHEDTEATARAVLERAEAAWVAVDAASARLLDRYGRERFFAATAGASVLLLNEDEAFALTDDEPEGATRALGDLYRLVCVKRGPAGAVATVEGELITASAPAVEEVDAAGAGDALAGVLLASLARGRAAAEALEAAVRAGAAAAASPAPWPESS